MNTLREFNELFNLPDFDIAIPEDINKSLDLNGMKFRISKNGNSIQVEFTSENEDEETFDDSDIKEIVEEFKDSISRLDDKVFLESLKKAKDAIDIKRFDELLNLEKYSEAEATEIECLMDYFTRVIEVTLESYIQDLLEYSKAFKK